jgi:exopolysaccharide production protein ExoZ
MYQSLQAGRAIAAILVVLFHLGSTIAADKFFGIEGFSIPFSFGGAGVEYFFVLSGFIIYYAHKNDISKPHRINNYLIKRFTRIYPTYWIVFFGVLLIPSLLWPDLRDAIPISTATLVKSALLLPQDMHGGTGAPVITVAWTLQYEMLFYLAFSLFIFNRYLGLTAVSIFIFLFIYNLFIENLQFPYSFIASDYILLFIMGVISAVICSSARIVIRYPIAYIFTGISLFIFTASQVVMQSDAIDGFHTIFYGLSSTLLVIGLVTVEKRGRVLFNNRAFQLLGDASYALYLIHYPLINILCKIAIILHMEQLGIYGALITYIVIFFTCIGASMIFHLFIEKPIARGIRNIVNHTKKANSFELATADKDMSRQA